MTDNSLCVFSLLGKLHCTSVFVVSYSERVALPPSKTEGLPAAHRCEPLNTSPQKISIQQVNGREHVLSYLSLSQPPAIFYTSRLDFIQPNKVVVMLAPILLATDNNK